MLSYIKLFLGGEFPPLNGSGLQINNIFLLNHKWQGLEGLSGELTVMSTKGF